MPYTKQEVLEAIAHAILTRALEAQDEEGNIDEATQDEVDRIAALAEEPALTEFLEELNAEEGGTSPSRAAERLSLEEERDWRRLRRLLRRLR